MTKKIITTYPEDDCDLDCECCDGAEADEDDDDAVYQLTPKGIACLALLRTGLVESIEDPRIDGFWELFQADMESVSLKKSASSSTTKLSKMNFIKGRK